MCVQRSSVHGNQSSTFRLSQISKAPPPRARQFSPEPLDVLQVEAEKAADGEGDVDMADAGASGSSSSAIDPAQFAGQLTGNF